MNNHMVVVYTSNNCLNSEQVLSKLSEWQIDYDERNISEHREYFKELQEQKVYGTPATFIGDVKVLGYQKRKLKQTLKIQN